MDENESTKNNMILLGGLWLSESKSTGEKFFSGNLGMNKILIFRNKRKNKESSPDYLMYIAPPLAQQKPDEDSPIDVPF